MKVGVGGTFNGLHRGHMALLDRAFELGDEVVIGLATDEFCRRRGKSPRPFAERKAELEGRLAGRTGWTIVPLDDSGGKVTQEEGVSALVVSPETLPSARDIAQDRALRRLKPLEIVVVPHVMAQDFLPISSTRILSGEIDEEGRLLRKLVVNVGSANRNKVEAVAEVMARLGIDAEVSGKNVGSGVPEQPFGDQTRQGAMERARRAIGSGDLGIGLEAGVFDAPDGLADVQWCCVLDRAGRMTMGHGPGFRYPPAVERRVRAGETVGDVFKRMYGWTDGLEREGAIGYLTNGAYGRKELSVQAVMAAMIPRVRQDLYPL